MRKTGQTILLKGNFIITFPQTSVESAKLKGITFFSILPFYVSLNVEQASGVS